MQPLQVMRERDVQLLIDLGILDERADEFTAFMVHGSLIHDPIVWQRSVALPLPDPNGPFPEPYANLHAVVGAMTKAEKIALRDRILARHQARKP